MFLHDYLMACEISTVRTLALNDEPKLWKTITFQNRYTKSCWAFLLRVVYISLPEIPLIV